MYIYIYSNLNIAVSGDPHLSVGSEPKGQCPPVPKVIRHLGPRPNPFFGVVCGAGAFH